MEPVEPARLWPEAHDELPEKLADCDVHWPVPGSELIIAEGDSAADAVAKHCDSSWQAVLPMQGKPMNVLTASDARIDANLQFLALRHAIGAGWRDSFAMNKRRYERLILLFDPDADGIHSRALLLFFLHEFMKPLLDAGVVYAARPPLWQIAAPGLAKPLFAWTDPQYHEVCAELDERGIHGRDTDRFRGVASMHADTLIDTCLDPKTRVLARLTSEHAKATAAAYANARSRLRSPH